MSQRICRKSKTMCSLPETLLHKTVGEFYSHSARLFIRVAKNRLGTRLWWVGVMC